MWLKLNAEYVAGIVAGAGLLLFLLALSVDSGMLNAEGLKGAGTKFAALLRLDAIADLAGFALFGELVGDFFLVLVAIIVMEKKIGRPIS